MNLNIKKLGPNLLNLAKQLKFKLKIFLRVAKSSKFNFQLKLNIPAMLINLIEIKKANKL